MKKMTNNREDYLKIIFKLKEAGFKVTNKLIAQHLNISTASVSEMLKKLAKDNLVVLYKNNIDLTDETIEFTKNLLSKHRLWETFLLTKLNYTWQDVHEQAERLEHVTDESLKAKLNEYLDYPVFCPHGSIIYENFKESNEDVVGMDSLVINDIAKIVRVHSDKELLSYLDRLGLNIGSEFEVISRDIFDNSMKIKYKDNEIIVSVKALSAIFVSKK